MPTPTATDPTNVSTLNPSADRLPPAAFRGLAGRQLWLALRFLIAMTVITGLAYPLVVFGVGQVIARQQADGSLLTRDGQTVGSTLIGQTFPDDQWFDGRPSAAGQGYDAMSSGGSNLAADSRTLTTTIDQRRAQIAAREHVTPSQVPPDAVTASASGLDPDISPAYAAIQVPRVAAARHLTAAQVEKLVAAHTDTPWLGFLGQDYVDVVQLNLALAEVTDG